MSDTKMVIIARKDLNMRKGKLAAQVAHACMKVFFDSFVPQYYHYVYAENESDELLGWMIPNRKYFREYIEGAFKKIVVYVESETELIDLFYKAQESGIHCSLILDSGLTEFHGVKTYTCVAIGPWDAEEIDKITGHLPLL